MDAERFLVDTSELANEELGVYVRLLATQWVNKDLPTEMDRLAALTQCELEKFKIIWKKISTKFALVDFRLVNLRMEVDRKSIARKTYFTSIAGTAGQDTKKKKVLKEIIYPWSDALFLEAWDLWKKYKKESYRFSYKSVISEQAALLALTEISINSTDAIALIKYAIARCWQGIYFNENAFKQHGNFKNKQVAGYDVNALNNLNDAIGKSND